jgi:hypothetical protein
MHRSISLIRGMARRTAIPLFAEKSSHPSVPLDFRSGIARSRGQGRSQTGACALPLTEASTVAPCRQSGSGTKGILAFLLMFSVCMVSTVPSSALTKSTLTKHNVRHNDFAAYVAEASQRFRIPAAWIRAVMRIESAGNRRAVSSKGAMGLMQIIPATWDELRIRYRLGKDPYDPRDNILAGTAYLRELHDRYGSPGFLAAYNAGPKRYEDYRSGKRSLPRETRIYIAALLPVVSDGDRSDRAIVATNYQQFQAQSSIFVSREKQRSNPFPAQKEFHTEVDGTVPFARDISGIVPLSEGLFVARTKEAGQ